MQCSTHWSDGAAAYTNLDAIAHYPDKQSPAASLLSSAASLLSTAASQSSTSFPQLHLISAFLSCMSFKLFSAESLLSSFAHSCISF